MSKKFICLTAVGLMFAIAGSAGAQLGKGKVLFEYWLNTGGGTSVDSNLTTNANFPNKPDPVVVAGQFQEQGRLAGQRGHPGPGVPDGAGRRRLHVLDLQ